MTYPQMEAWVNEDSKHRSVKIVIEHDHGQSFRRSVVPRAKKEMKRWVSEHIMFGLPYLEHEGTMLGGQYIRDSKDRCLSVIHFTY